MKQFSYQLCKDEFFAFLDRCLFVLKDRRGGLGLEGMQSGYHKETQTAVFQGKPITVTHLTPVLTPAQREKRKDEIENQLYDVFVKYSKNKSRAG